MVAEISAPWWMDALLFLALLGYLTLIFQSVLGLVRRVTGLLLRPVTIIVVNRNEIRSMVSSRDSTRPNFREDENAAWVNVTRKMQQIENRAKRKK